MQPDPREPEDPLGAARGCFHVAVFYTVGALILLLLLSGCATVPQRQPGELTGLTCRADCDNKWCWPDFTLQRPTYLTLVDNPRQWGSRMGWEPGDGYAFNYSGPGVCRIVMRDKHQNTSWRKLLCHEAWHCENRQGHDHTDHGSHRSER